jgi:hypothetical protein
MKISASTSTGNLSGILCRNLVNNLPSNRVFLSRDQRLLSKGVNLHAAKLEEADLTGGNLNRAFVDKAEPPKMCHPARGHYAGWLEARIAPSKAPQRSPIEEHIQTYK